MTRTRVHIILLSVGLAFTGNLTLTTPAQAAASSQCVQVNGRADGRCNPGLVANTPEVLADAPQYRHTLCEPSDGNPDTKTWTQWRRPPSSYTNRLKRTQMAAYGLTDDPRFYEEDHITPLALDGHPTDPRNLYPQRWEGVDGARVKDREESSLWRMVCNGSITLPAAQAKIQRDWVQYPTGE